MAKGTITSWSCDPSVNGLTAAGKETDYVFGPDGEQVTEMAQGANGTMTWQRTYIYAAGALIGPSIASDAGMNGGFGYNWCVDF